MAEGLADARLDAMSWRASALLLLCAICWGRAADADSVVDGSGSPDLKLLFVGNSLIYYNGGVYKVRTFCFTLYPLGACRHMPTQPLPHAHVASRV